jgi:hypothetical protein
VDDALVRNPIRVALCRDEDAYNCTVRALGIPVEERKPWLDESALACVHFVWDDRGELVALVCIGKVRDRIDVSAALTHEAVHIWQRAKQQLGATGEGEPGLEFEAYAIQNISRNLIAAYHGR